MSSGTHFDQGWFVVIGGGHAMFPGRRENVLPVSVPYLIVVSLEVAVTIVTAALSALLNSDPTRSVPLSIIGGSCQYCFSEVLKYEVH